MNLPQEVENYYFDHISELDNDKQFHLATRLYGWSQEPRAKRMLDAFKPSYAYGKEIHEDLSGLISNPPAAKINALETRQPYFDKYPVLRGRIFALFKVRHLRDMYGIDVRQQLLTIVDRQELEELAECLVNDPEGIRILSTYAINYLYLVRQILFESPESMTGFLTSLQTVTDGYDRSDPTDVQLLIYLYTHCIIGASNFYLNAVPAHHKELYIHMTKELEPLLTSMYDHINLDNKFEYLVCCRIIGYDTPLFERVFEEATRSISPDGTFVIDTHNDNRQGTKISLNDSEHRNVLLVMSARPYHSI